ncbi:hypothetical protein, partial [Planobispora rosea]|uniref:hypothetical protein n=1 Tax=Planobispora rosea TaxID=35762 RepID=UPI00194124BD
PSSTTPPENADAITTLIMTRRDELSTGESLSALIRYEQLPVGCFREDQWKDHWSDRTKTPPGSRQRGFGRHPRWLRRVVE